MLFNGGGCIIYLFYNQIIQSTTKQKQKQRKRRKNYIVECFLVSSAIRLTHVNTVALSVDSL